MVSEKGLWHYFTSRLLIFSRDLKSIRFHFFGNCQRGISVMIGITVFFAKKMSMEYSPTHGRVPILLSDVLKLRDIQTSKMESHFPCISQTTRTGGKIHGREKRRSKAIHSRTMYLDCMTVTICKASLFLKETLHTEVFLKR